MKKISILGSTGSIGVQTLNIIRMHPDKFKVAAITGNSNLELLKKQADEFCPELIGICDETLFSEAKSLFAGSKAKLVFGKDALIQSARLEGADTVVAAVVGMCGLESVVEAVKAGKNVALANKESLVAGGEIVMRLTRENGVKLYPVDSEHSAVWQCLAGNSSKEMRRIILTASGGSFFGKKREELKGITPALATKHPNWSMGKKITVDSSTMMNKGLEIIEARWLFDTFDIDYIIHRESVIHSMVEFNDGSIIAQMSNPDMQIPISLALSYPQRFETGVPFFNFDKNLTFFQPNEENFRMPLLAKQALKTGGTALCVLNSANEAAVSLFLEEKIGFTQIQDIVENVLNSADITFKPQLETIIATHNYWIEKLKRDYKQFLN